MIDLKPARVIFLLAILILVSFHNYNKENKLSPKLYSPLHLFDPVFMSQDIPVVENIEKNNYEISFDETLESYEPSCDACISIYISYNDRVYVRTVPSKILPFDLNNVNSILQLRE